MACMSNNWCSVQKIKMEKGLVAKGYVLRLTKIYIDIFLRKFFIIESTDYAMFRSTL